MANKRKKCLIFRFLPLLFSFTLCTAAQAATSSEIEAVFQKAMQIAEENQQRFYMLVEQEQLGQLDEKLRTQAAQEMTRNTLAYETELSKASAGGHAVATYLLATLQEGRRVLRGFDYAKQAEACRLYQTAAEQGLIAGAVALLRDCESASRRFMFDDPELMRLRGLLFNALDRPDKYSAHYPLPATTSLCFKEPKMFAVNNELSLTAMMDAYAPTLLSLEQFRADGFYLLAVKADIENPAARDYFQQVLAMAPDCMDPINIGVRFNAKSGKPAEREAK
ncbi:hypothetical protein ACMYUJ_21600 [Stutzerimonas zhaodongensis]|uniref:hypothetical protein n=1 Tax=Stutzerimonas zhaodongensis TaxID=1176257 RepID=UPI0039EFA0EF